MTEYESDFIEAAVKLVDGDHVPYIWAGKGPWCVRDGHVLRMAAVAGCEFGLDCSGLVTHCAAKANPDVDLRGMWNANRMFKSLPETDELPCLVLFGKDGFASHVAIELEDGSIIESAGGDHTTLTKADSDSRHAGVRHGPLLRHDVLGRRSIDALRNAKP